MEKHKHLKACATAAAFLLIGTFAVAQTATSARTLKPSERRAPSNKQRKDGAIAHADYPRSAEQRKSGDTGGIDGGSNASAHAGARSNAPSDAPNKAPGDAPNKASSNARTGENPLYQDRGNSGENPLYESKDQMMKPNAGNSNSQPNASTAADTSSKHLAGVKYQNRTASGQQSSKRSSTEHFKQDFGQVQATKR